MLCRIGPTNCVRLAGPGQVNERYETLEKLGNSFCLAFKFKYVLYSLLKLF